MNSPSTLLPQDNSFVSGYYSDECVCNDAIIYGYNASVMSQAKLSKSGTSGNDNHREKAEIWGIRAHTRKNGICTRTTTEIEMKAENPMEPLV